MFVKRLNVLVILTIFSISSSIQYELSDITYARIETCRGCSLNRLPEVKDFVLNDAPKYDRVAVEFINGAKPELVLLTSGDQELERLPLSALTRSQCIQLLEEKGFQSRSGSAQGDL